MWGTYGATFGFPFAHASSQPATMSQAEERISRRSTITINRQAFRVTGATAHAEGTRNSGDREPDRQRVLIHLKRLWEGLRGSEIKMSGMFAGCDEVAYYPNQ